MFHLEINILCIKQYTICNAFVFNVFLFVGVVTTNK